MSKQDCEKLLLQKMGEQEDRCAITGLPLGYDRECEDKEMLVSLDRIDSSGHYTPDNVQLVCRFVNRWKRAEDDAEFRRLMDTLRIWKQWYFQSRNAAFCGRLRPMWGELSYADA